MESQLCIQRTGHHLGMRMRDHLPCTTTQATRLRVMILAWVLAVGRNLLATGHTLKVARRRQATATHRHLGRLSLAQRRLSKLQLAATISHGTGQSSMLRS